MNEVTEFLVSHGGAVLFGIVFVEQAGLPLPSAPWLLAAGALSATGKLNPVLAMGLVASASVLADSIWFYVGRRGGPSVLRLFCRLSLAKSSCVGRTKGLFARQGVRAMVAAKFLPGLGAVMPPLAGALGMSAGRFLLVDSLGSLFYGGFYIVVGFVFRNQLQKVAAVLNELGFSTLLLGVALIPAYIAFKYVRRRRPAIEERNSARKGTEASDQRLVFARGNAEQSAAGNLNDNKRSEEFENIAVALTSAVPQPSRNGARSSLVQLTPL